MSPHKPHFHSARLHLRPVTETDAPHLCALDADDEVRRHLDQLAPPTLQAIQNEMIPRWQTYDRQTPATGFWIAELFDQYQFAGWFHLRSPKPESQLRPDDLELGYRLRRDCWNKGLATEGSRVLMHYAFNTLHAPRVAATALQANTASIQVMKKLGMRLDVEWLYKADMPAVAYAITAGE